MPILQRVLKQIARPH